MASTDGVLITSDARLLIEPLKKTEVWRGNMNPWPTALSAATSERDLNAGPVPTSLSPDRSYLAGWQRR